MKRSKLIILSAVFATACFGVNAQSANSSGNPSGSLPPGLQNRQQLPPGLQNRSQLPPGLQKRLPQTNSVGENSQSSINNQSTLGQYGSTSNQAGGLTPTSNRGSTNRIYETNNVSTSTQTTTTMQDRAYTAADQRLLVQIRHKVLPMLRTAVPSGYVGATGEAWAPVHFIVQQNVVTLVGFVPTYEEREHIVTSVQRTPGVVQVIDQLQIRQETNSELGSSGAASTNQGSATIEGGGTSAIGSSTSSNQFGLTTSNRLGSTNTSQFGATNQLGTSNNQFGSTSANQAGSTNLAPTGSETNRVYRQGLPPGLQRREQLPPGLQNREPLPPGLQPRSESTNSPNE